jgi:hypothetical protein
MMRRLDLTNNERAVLITMLRRLVDFHHVVSFKSPADTPRCSECCGIPRLLCRGTRSSNPSPSSEESCANPAMPANSALPVAVPAGALGQQLLDIAVAQGEAKIQPNRVLDDLGGEAMTAVAERSHAGILTYRHSRDVSVTMPSTPFIPRPLSLSDKGHLLPDFYSGATGPPGRFSGGFLLRRLQLEAAVDRCLAYVVARIVLVP